MEFTIDRDSFLKSLGHANGIIEKKTTLPILSNVLIEAKNSKIIITATDLDIIYFEEITPHEIKTIITRVGEGTKVVFTGDIDQIDNVYVDATTNGLTYTIEKFKHHDVSGHITLQKGERSKVASLAAKIL